MFTPEQFKKLIEIAKPEGFRFTLSGDSKLGGGYMEYMGQPCSVFGLSMPDSLMYPLFIQKCIEGVINNLEHVMIYQGFISVDVRIEQSGSPTNLKTFRIIKGYDLAKEQALIYILENIK